MTERSDGVTGARIQAAKVIADLLRLLRVRGSVCRPEPDEGAEGSLSRAWEGGPLTLPSLVAIMLDMTYYVYILSCADNDRYYGYTSDLARRLQEHRQGEVPSTKPRRPVKLVYYEIFAEASEARKREHGLKNGRTRSKKIDWLIKTFPREKLLPFA